MGDKPDKWYKKNIIRICFILGIVLFFGFGSWLHHINELEQNWLLIEFLSIVKEIGFALVIAAIVSWLFDTGYLDFTFIRPIQELLEKIGDFNQLVGYTKKRGISAIFGRKQGNNKEIDFWKKTIKETINEADEYLLITARALDTLIPIPIQNDNVGIISNLEKVLKGKPQLKIIIILANNFDKTSGYRKECDIRAQISESQSAAYYIKARDTLKLCLKIPHDLKKKSKLDKYESIAVKLTDMSPPFAMFMNEKRAVIEPYIFCVEGGKNLIYSVTSDKLSNVNNKKHHIYESHFRSYKHILEGTNEKEKNEDGIDIEGTNKNSVFNVVKRYRELNKNDPDKIKATQNTLKFAKEMSDHEEAFKKSVSEIFSRLDKS